MSVYDKQSISDLLFEKVDSIIIVDAKNDTYQAIKKKGIFEKIVEDTGNYKTLVEKLWFHFNNNSKKITDDYHVFVPIFGQFNKYYYWW